jgi:hypothetical protein
MRSFRSARLLVLPMVVLPLVLSTVVLSGTAWAKAKASKATCGEVTGTFGGSWQMQACTPASYVGGGTQSISINFPTVAGSHNGVVFTWSPRGFADPREGGSTTFGFTLKQLVGHRDKCAKTSPGSSEWELSGGRETHFTGNSNLKGRLKGFICVSKLGALSTYRNKFVKL